MANAEDGSNFEPKLELWTGYYQPPSAREISDLIGTIDAAFSEFRVNEGLGVKHLVIQHLAINSFEVWFTIFEKLSNAVEIGELILEHKVQLTNFCEDARGIIFAALNVSPLPEGTALRHAIATLARPIAEKRSSGMKMFVRGTNGVVVEIDNVTDAIIVSTAIKAALEEDRKIEQQMRRVQEISIEKKPPKPLTIDGRVREGEMFKNRGAWYVKIHGNHVPVKSSSHMKSLNGSRRYSAFGILLGKADRPIFEPDWASLTRID